MKSVIRSIVLTSSVVIAAFAGAITYSTTTHAASGGLTVSPTSVDATVAPGGTYKGEMLVMNQGELDIAYTVYATPYSVTGEEYKPYFSPVKGATDITKWFTFDKSSNDSLKIGMQESIPYTITVPKNVGAGGYYATIFAETADKGGAGVVTRKRVGMIVYLRVSGNVKESGSINSWNVDWMQQAPLRADVKVANTGSVHFKANVHVTVSDLFGSKKFSYERNPEILPQKLRDIPISWENGATYGLFKVSGEVTYLNKTEQLPTRYVFVANLPMGLLTAVSIIAFIALVVFGSRRVAVRKK
jgi:hypothetical protein